MTASIIDGRIVALASRSRTHDRVAAFVRYRGYAPGLATILVGDDPASQVYVRNKRRAATAAGFVDLHHHLPDSATEPELAKAIDEAVHDCRVAGVLLQLPLPPRFDSAAMIERIPAEKDIDGLTTISQGRIALGAPGLRPCTPSGVIELLDNAGVPIDGAAAVVVGRSRLVGHPVAELLTHRNATVTLAHSHTRDLTAICKQADILIAAAGRPGLITAEHIKPGAAVIDVGIHRTPEGLTGDVRFDEAADIAGWLTPVPGGVGPMTIALLLSNTIDAAELLPR